MAVTLKQLSEMLDCDISTVSRVLNDKPNRVSPEKKNEILKAARNAGYIFNRNAQSLASGKTSMIGVMIRHVTDSILAEYVEAIDRYLSLRKYSVIPFITGEDPERERKCLEALPQRQVDAMISLFYNEENERFYKQLKSQGHKMIFRAPDTEKKIGFDAVYLDIGIGYYHLCQYLFRKGCRYIVVVGGHAADAISEGKTSFAAQYFAKAHEEAGLELCRQQGIQCDNNSRSAYDRLYEYLKTARPVPDGIIVQNPDKLLGVCKALSDCKLRIPGHVRVCVNGGNDAFSMLPYPVASWAQPLDDIAKGLGELTMMRLENPDAPSRYITLKSKLMEGNK